MRVICSNRQTWRRAAAEDHSGPNAHHIATSPRYPHPAWPGHGQVQAARVCTQSNPPPTLPQREAAIDGHELPVQGLMPKRQPKDRTSAMPSTSASKRASSAARSMAPARPGGAVDVSLLCEGTDLARYQCHINVLCVVRIARVLRLQESAGVLSKMFSDLTQVEVGTAAPNKKHNVDICPSHLRRPCMRFQHGQSSSFCCKGELTLN